MATDTRAEIIRAQNVTKRFGKLVAVDNVTYLLRENEVAGIIGSNGAGKTTFFNLLTGFFPPDQGSIFYKGEDVTRMSPQQRVGRGLMRTFQLTATFDNLSVIDNLVLAFFRAHRKSSHAAAAAEHLQRRSATIRRSSRPWKPSTCTICATGW